MQIEKLGVVGAGQMGNGIAQVAASIGLSVVMVDVSEASLQKGLATISSSCDRLIKKEKLTEAQKKDLLSRIRISAETKALADCDLVVEAATENVDLKVKIFRELDQVVNKNAILCTNTSSISITKIAAATSRPEKV